MKRLPATAVVFLLALGLYAATTHRRVFIAGNDASRWAAIESLVDYGTASVERSRFAANIDRIRIGEHDYSNKPPLLVARRRGDLRRSAGALRLVARRRRGGERPLLGDPPPRRSAERLAGGAVSRRARALSGARRPLARCCSPARWAPGRCSSPSRRRSTTTRSLPRCSSRPSSRRSTAADSRAASPSAWPRRSTSCPASASCRSSAGCSCRAAPGALRRYRRRPGWLPGDRRRRQPRHPRLAPAGEARRRGRRPLGAGGSRGRGSGAAAEPRLSARDSLRRPRALRGLAGAALRRLGPGARLPASAAVLDQPGGSLRGPFGRRPISGGPSPSDWCCSSPGTPCSPGSYGGWSYGYRYLLPIQPLLLFCAPLALAGARRSRRRCRNSSPQSCRSPSSLPPSGPTIPGRRRSNRSPRDIRWRRLVENPVGGNAAGWLARARARRARSPAGRRGGSSVRTATSSGAISRSFSAAREISPR